MSRILAADALRGLALLGICMVNAWYYADPLGVSGAPSPVTDTAAGDVTSFVVGVLASASPCSSDRGRRRSR